jgi:hypothetical protein
VQQIALTKWDWATLLKRVWGFDALTCTGCGGRMRFIAVIRDRAVIERILQHIGEDAEEPRFARARDPCDLWARGRASTRGERVVWEGDVRPLRVEGDGFGQRGGGSVAGCQRDDANVRRWGTSSLRTLGVSSTSRAAHEAEDCSSEMLERRTALEFLSSLRDLHGFHSRAGKHA